MRAAELIDIDHIDEVFDLLLDVRKADVAVELRLQVGEVLLRERLRLVRLFLRGLRGGGLAAVILGRGLLLWRAGHVFKRCTPEVAAHAAQIPLGHGADRLQLLEDDFVFFIHVPSPFQRDSFTFFIARNSSPATKPVSVPVKSDTASSTGRYPSTAVPPSTIIAAPIWPMLCAAAPPMDTP